jgi:hypothetical protein
MGVEVVLVRSRGTLLAAELMTLRPPSYCLHGQHLREGDGWLVGLPYGDARVMAAQQPEGRRKPFLACVSNVEAGTRDELKRVAIEIASTGNNAPEPVESILQPSPPAGIRLPVFEKDQPPARLQDAPDLRQRGPRVRNGAEGISDDNRVGETMRQRYAFAAGLQAFEFEGQGAVLPFRQGEHGAVGIDADEPPDFGHIVVGQVQA